MCGECRYYKPISNCRGCCTIKDCTKNAGTKHCGNFSKKEIALFLKEIEKRTCRNIAEDYADVDQFVCSECGIELQDWDRVERDEDTGEESFHEYTLKYCPNCGRRIEYDD